MEQHVNLGKKFYTNYVRKEKFLNSNYNTKEVFNKIK